MQPVSKEHEPNYQFGEFERDPVRRVLLRKGKAIPLRSELSCRGADQALQNCFGLGLARRIDKGMQHPVELRISYCPFHS